MTHKKQAAKKQSPRTTDLMHEVMSMEETVKEMTANEEFVPHSLTNSLAALKAKLEPDARTTDEAQAQAIFVALSHLYTDIAECDLRGTDPIITRVLQLVMQHMDAVGKPKHITAITADDWVEIYYALEYKMQSPAVKGSDAEARRWREHLQSIITTIGPDGRNMTALHARAHA